MKYKAGDRIVWSSIRKGTIIEVTAGSVFITWDNDPGKVGPVRIPIRELNMYVQKGLVSIE